MIRSDQSGPGMSKFPLSDDMSEFKYFSERQIVSKWCIHYKQLTNEVSEKLCTAMLLRFQWEIEKL